MIREESGEMIVCSFCIEREMVADNKVIGSIGVFRQENIHITDFVKIKGAAI